MKPSSAGLNSTLQLRADKALDVDAALLELAGAVRQQSQVDAARSPTGQGPAAAWRPPDRSGECGQQCHPTHAVCKAPPSGRQLWTW
ncbi:MAG: hypothetical protein MZW92_81635 [Comamonadaceae bacterium]|nr:hypothetical protein [Comamonadaceae bacterium]